MVNGVPDLPSGCLYELKIGGLDVLQWCSWTKVLTVLFPAPPRPITLINRPMRMEMEYR